MIIPHTELPADTLQRLLEDFATRDGTDYGEQEVSLRTKVEQLKRQLERKEIFISYSELHETVGLITQTELATGMNQKQD